MQFPLSPNPVSLAADLTRYQTSKTSNKGEGWRRIPGQSEVGPEWQCNRTEWEELGGDQMAG